MLGFSEKIIILDFGSQYNQLIARRIRECNVYCDLLPYDTNMSEIIKQNPKGIILSGGPNSVYEKNAPKISAEIFSLNIPILGICYGMQFMSFLLKGKVIGNEKHEYGKTDLFVKESYPLFANLNPKLICWMSHGDTVEKMPVGFEILASTYNTPIAAMGYKEKKFYGIQFHPEVSHTPWGIELLRNFLFKVCNCKGGWTMGNFIKQQKEEIKNQVQKGNVICALSGGIDSAATAVLVHQSIGKRLHCIFVDHGFLRKDEALQVQKTFAENFKLNLHFEDQKKIFLKKLKNVTEPEQKRIIIGREFIKIFENRAKKIGEVKYLAQGTLYPDVIESKGIGKAQHKIKTHHNVGGLPEKMKLKLIEPLKFLFKDEVRKLAEELGLPPEITYRQPFPGPGLAIRIIGDVTQERLEILRQADAILIEEIIKANLYREIWQTFAVLLTVRNVGIMGDKRTYKYPIIIRAITSEDGMTADWAKNISLDVLEKISSRITNEVPDVNRVAFDITSKPPATIEWE